MCLQLAPSGPVARRARPALVPLNRRGHRPRFPRHAFRTALSDSGELVRLTPWPGAAGSSSPPGSAGCSPSAPGPAPTTSAAPAPATRPSRRRRRRPAEDRPGAPAGADTRGAGLPGALLTTPSCASTILSCALHFHGASRTRY